MSDLEHLRDWDPLEHMSVESAVEDTLRALTTNLMRISRGAGEPYNLGRQLTECVSALRRYAQERGELPSNSQFQAMLDFRRTSKDQAPQERATTDIIRASLRVAAAELQGNRLQRDAGERDLYQAIRWLNEERAERAANHKR